VGLLKAVLHKERALLRLQSMQEAALMRMKGAKDRQIQQNRKLALLLNQSLRPARQLEMRLVQLLG